VSKSSTVLELVPKLPFLGYRIVASAASNVSLSFELDLFILARFTCCDECVRVRRINKPMQLPLFLVIGRNRKHCRIQLLFRGQPRMRYLVSHSDGVQSLESIIG
jgi:hypothetical protein